ncbi:MAG: hypothetical protein H6721_19335 [Sandaracinus sp.]|nr:hypothetical protein [Myxococcales bacterium]MCB9602046.1 hypothetical protein [Sandaracinus sp.]MCB9624371.1 hypothetical protein [Sandaracinus sp.]MCB9634283.1 hypothetical protein [Sandaracinus sp.]
MSDDVPRANGALIAKERELMERLVGAATVRTALTTVPEDVRASYEGLTALTKIPTAHVETVYYAIATVAGRDPLELHREVVRAAVEDALRTMWRLLLRFTSDDAIIRRTPLFFARGLSRGELSARMTNRGEAEIRLTGWPGVSLMQLNGISAAIEAVLLCAGRRQVRVEAQRTLDGGRFEARWDT